MYYVYILESKKTGELYKGFCRNLRKRLGEHNTGKNVSTKSNQPWALIHYQAFVCKDDALEQERFLKTGWGRNYIQRTLKKYLEMRQ